MAIGAIILDGDGRRLLQADGKLHLSDDAGDDCCCGEGCQEVFLDVIDEHNADNPPPDVDPSNITLAWYAPVMLPGGVTITDWTVQRRLKGETVWVDIGTTSDSPFTDTTAAPATTYEYRVRANLSDGSVIYSCDVLEWCTCAAPTAPKPTLSVSGHVVTISWTSPASTGCDGPNFGGNTWTDDVPPVPYSDSMEIWRSDDSTTWSFVAEVAVGGVGSYSYDDTVPDGTYYYALRCVNYNTGGQCAFGPLGDAELVEVF